MNKFIIIVILSITATFTGNATNSNYIKSQIDKEYSNIGNDSIAFSSTDLLKDSLKRNKDYWKKALMRGKLDLKDETIEYPKFIGFCVDVYNWADRTFNTYNPDYVVGTGKKWKLMLKNDNWVDSYALHFHKNMPVRMLSDLCSNAGVSLAYMAVSAGYMFNMGNVFGGNPITHTDWNFQFCCALVAIDAYYQKNSGGTNIKQIGSYNGGKWMDYKFDGLHLESYGIDAYYFFNNKKYSQGAAYNYSKFQKKSAGSMIAGVTVSSQDVSIDFSNVPEEMISALPDGGSNLKYRFRYYDYCFLLGYGYNWVFSKHWLFNISALPSIGMKHCLDISEDGEQNLFSANIKAKIGVVYNHRQLFTGFVGKMDGHWYSSDKYNFFNAVENFNLVVGVRF